MTSTNELKNVPDDELLRRLSELLKQSRRVESVLVAHIGEVDERKLYSREASSMFTHCTGILNLSEHEAYTRITAARTARKYPVLLATLGDGRLHLSGIAKLAPHLTNENNERVLSRAAHKTKRQIEELIAEITPRPDVPSLVRKLPVRAEATNTVELGPDRVTVLPSSSLAPLTLPAQSRTAPPSTPAPPAKPSLTAPPVAAVQPLSPARYKVQFTASAELRDKVERLRALTREDLATAIEAVVSERLERLEAKRFGLTRGPRKSLEETDTSPDFLMCRRHNTYLAELEYGKEWMEQFRRGGDRVSETAPAYFLRYPLTMLPAYGAGRSRDA